MESPVSGNGVSANLVLQWSARERWTALAILLLIAGLVLTWYSYSIKSALLANETARLERHAEIVRATLSERLQSVADVIDSAGKDFLISTALTSDKDISSRFLCTVVTGMTGVSNLLIVNTSGQAVASNKPLFLHSTTTTLQRFRVIRDFGTANLLYVSEPFLTVDGDYTIAVGKAVHDDNQQFIGVVLAELQPGFFATLLESVLYENDMRAGLIQGKGNVWFWMLDPDSLTGSRIGDDPRSLFRQFMLSGEPRKVLQGPSLATGIQHLVAFSTVSPVTIPADNPLIISLSRELDVLYAPWFKQTALNVAIYLLLGFSLIGLLLFLEKRRRLYEKQLFAAETARLRAEGHVLAERKSLREVVHAADVGIYNWNLQNNLIQINERWASLLGYRLGELQPLSRERWRSLIHDDDLAMLDKALSSVLHEDRQFAECQLRMQHKKGDWVWILNRFSVVERDSIDQPVRISGVHLDITQRHAAEEMTQQAFLYARSLLEASLDPVVAINAEGKITDLNQATVKATGVERDKLIGTDFSNYFTLPHKARRGYELVFAEGFVKDYPLVLRHASGSTVDVLYNASVYHDQTGEVAGVFAVARDVTQLKSSQQELERTNHEILLLAELNNLLQSCNKLDEAFPIIVKAMQQLFPGSSGRCHLLKANDGQLLQEALWGNTLEQAPVITAADCWALRLGHTHEFGFADSINPECRYMANAKAPHFCLPLQALGQALGIMHLLPAPGSLTPELLAHTRQMAKAAADSISLVLANLRLRESLQAMSVRDPLTGLYNRRFMEEELAREISHMQRLGKSLAVAMLDLDHFKQFNDNYGHEAGDVVLKEFARLMQDFREGSDVACRYGGEEFVLVLPEVTLEQARQRFERLCESVSKLFLHLDDQTLPNVTVSIGFSLFPADGRYGKDLLKQADAALYRAKDAGRNRVVAVSDVIEDSD